MGVCIYSCTFPYVGPVAYSKPTRGKNSDGRNQNKSSYFIGKSLFATFSTLDNITNFHIPLAHNFGFYGKVHQSSQLRLVGRCHTRIIEKYVISHEHSGG